MVTDAAKLRLCCHHERVKAVCCVHGRDRHVRIICCMLLVPRIRWCAIVRVVRGYGVHAHGVRAWIVISCNQLHATGSK